MIEFLGDLLTGLLCVIACEFAILFGKFTIEMLMGDDEE